MSVFIPRQRNSTTKGRAMPGEGDIQRDTCERAVDCIVSILREAMDERGLDASSLQNPTRLERNKTRTGVFLVMRNGSPWSVQTPQGETALAQMALPKLVVSQLMERLAADVYTPVRVEGLGTVGPVYSVFAVDNLRLPPPTMFRLSA